MNLDKEPPVIESESNGPWVALVAAVVTFAVMGIVAIYTYSNHPSENAWHIESRKDPITDVVEIEATLGGAFEDAEGSLWMNCSTTDPQIRGFVTALPLFALGTGSEPKEIKYAVRFDDAKPIRGSIMGPENQQIIRMDAPFLRRLANSKKLAYRVGDHTVVFDTSEASAVIDRLSDTCT